MDPSSPARISVARVGVMVAGTFVLTMGAGLAVLHHAAAHDGAGDGQDCALCLHLDGNPAASPPAVLNAVLGTCGRLAPDFFPAVAGAVTADRRSRAPPRTVSVP